jgi:hypothetical protein
MTQPQAVKQDNARSPFAGCAIFIAAFLVMTFLIGFSVLTLFRQFNEIAKFTDDKPVAIEVSPTAGKEAQLKSLADRLETFRQQLAGDAETSLTLSADDLNLAIASYDAFKELRGTFRILTIEEKTARIAISFPLNGKPRLTRSGEKSWITSDSRYLNGTMIAHPALLKKEVVLALDTIDVPDKKVAPQFIEQMSPYRITERYLSDPVIGPVMAKITRVGIADGKIILSRKPGETPVNTITDAQVDSGSSRLFTTLGIAAVCFLAFAGVIILIGIRKKDRSLS